MSMDCRYASSSATADDMMSAVSLATTGKEAAFDAVEGGQLDVEMLTLRWLRTGGVYSRISD